jgi:hypothetical protein
LPGRENEASQDKDSNPLPGRFSTGFIKFALTTLPGILLARTDDRLRAGIKQESILVAEPENGTFSSADSLSLSKVAETSYKIIALTVSAGKIEE